VNSPVLLGARWLAEHLADSRLLFGLGASTKIDEIEVRWPSGQVSNLKNVNANQYLTIKESAGR